MAIDSKIRSIIEVFGHIKIDEMMREALSTSPGSYYQSQTSIGEKGDFITAPEISQLFGETIGFWIISKWEQLGRPKDFALVELGPGQGILMHNIMRVAKLETQFQKSAEIFLFEINKHFIKKQQKNLDFTGKKINWINHIDQLPSKPCIIISNEFFDALPIKQYIKLRHKWYETVLVFEPLDGRLKFDKIQLHKALFEQLGHDYPQAGDGAVIEESPFALEIMRKIAKHLVKFRGACLSIDYGYDIEPASRTRRQFNSTLQAVKNHQYCPIIDTLGEADLSSHVDFYALKNAAMQQGIKNTTISSQHDFLVNHGIILRHELLKKKCFGIGIKNFRKTT
jgi:NADH dehydrogenase [ubiquinone] 1 alpha subcomplex assembly factor 7